MSDALPESQPETSTPTSIDALVPRMMLNGKVTRAELGGVYVDIGVGVDGFVHISQLVGPADAAVTRVADAFKPGDALQVYVSRVSVERKRVDLTMRKPATFDWSNLKIGSKVHNVKVVAVESFGAFVNFDGPKDGLVPFNLMPKGLRPKAGDNIETVWVIEVNESKNRVGMTMVEPPALPWESIQRGQEFKGVVTRFERNGAYVDIGAEREGLIRPASIGAGYADMRTVVSEGEEVTVKVIKVDASRKIIDLTLPGINSEEFALSSGPEETIGSFAAALMRAQKVAKRAAAVAAKNEALKKPVEQAEPASVTQMAEPAAQPVQDSNQ